MSLSRRQRNRIEADHSPEHHAKPVVGSAIVEWTTAISVAATGSLRSWRHEPEWPLLQAAHWLLFSFVLHAVGYVMAKLEVVFTPPVWEGRTGWRKPMLFGVSNAVIFTALRVALRSQSLVPRGLAAHFAAWSTLLEVGIITLQAWRDEPSHFNTSSVLNTLLYAIKLLGATVLGLVCLASFAGCVLRPTVRGPQLAALRCVLLRHSS